MHRNDRIPRAALKPRPVNDLFTNEGCFQQSIHTRFRVTLKAHLVLDYYACRPTLGERFQHSRKRLPRGARSWSNHRPFAWFCQTRRVNRLRGECVGMALMLIDKLTRCE